MKKIFLLLGVLCVNLCSASDSTTSEKISDIAKKYPYSDINTQYKYFIKNYCEKEKIAHEDTLRWPKYLALRELYCDFLNTTCSDDICSFFGKVKNYHVTCGVSLSVSFDGKGQLLYLTNGLNTPNNIIFMGLFYKLKVDNLDKKEVENKFEKLFLACIFDYVQELFLAQSNKTLINTKKIEEEYGLKWIYHVFFTLNELGLFFRQCNKENFNNDKNDYFFSLSREILNVDLSECFNYESQNFIEFSKEYEELEKNGFGCAAKDYMCKLYFNAMCLSSVVHDILCVGGNKKFQGKINQEQDSYFLTFMVNVSFAFGFISNFLYKLGKTPEINKFVKKIFFKNKYSELNMALRKDLCKEIIGDERISLKDVIELIFICNSESMREERKKVLLTSVENISLKEKIMEKIIATFPVSIKLKILTGKVECFILPFLLIQIVEKIKNYYNFKNNNTMNKNCKKKKNGKKKHETKMNLNPLFLNLFIPKNDPYKNFLFIESNVTSKAQEDTTLEGFIENFKQYLPCNEKGDLYAFIIGANSLRGQEITFIEGKINNHESLNDIFFRTDKDIEKINEKINKEINEQNVFKKNAEENNILKEQLSRVLGDMDGKNDHNEDLLVYALNKKEELKDQEGQKEESKLEQKNPINENKQNFEYYNQNFFQEMYVEYDRKKQSKGDNEKQKQKTMNKSFIDDINNTKNVVLLKNAVGIKDHLSYIINILKTKLSLDKKVDISDEKVLQMYFSNPLQTQSKPFNLSGKNSCFEVTISGKMRIFYTIEGGVVNIIGFHNKHRYNKALKDALLQRKVFCGNTLDDVMQQYNEKNKIVFAYILTYFNPMI